MIPECRHCWRVLAAQCAEKGGSAKSNILQHTAVLLLKVKYKSSMVTQVTASQIGPLVLSAVCIVQYSVCTVEFIVISI